MNKSSILVITVPIGIVCVILAGVLLYRSVTVVQDQTKIATNTVPVAIPSLSATNNKPTVGFGKLQSSNPVSDLRQEYDASTDEGGISSLDSLQEQAASL